MKRSSCPVLAVAFAVGLLVAACIPQPPTDYTKISDRIPMRDGTLIAVDVFLPKECAEPCEPPFPLVLEYLPYQRATADPFVGFLTGDVDDAADSETVRFLLSQGYAFARADMRGTGASTGWRMEFMPEIMDDGKEIVDWLGSQSWCDGNVGMIGGSYLGWSQLAVASRAPEALKCIMPQVVPFDGFSSEVYPGGIYLYAFVQIWAGGMYMTDRNLYIPGQINPTVPAFDEDGDGSYVDEIPLDRDFSGTFIDDYPWPVDPSDPPQYLDGVPRTVHAFFNATMEHAAHPDGRPGNYDMDEVARDLYFIDGPIGLDDLTPYDLLNNILPDVAASGVPIYDVGGWFDGFTRGTCKLFATLRRTNPSKMLVQPTYHGAVSQGFADLFGLDPENFTRYAGKVKEEMIRWLDHWLKGIDNGIDREPPIEIYVMNGEGWRKEQEWPLARQRVMRYYFEENGGLATVRTSQGTDTYTADYSHNSGFEPIDVSFLGMIGRPTVSDTYYTNRYTSLAGFAPTRLAVRTDKDLKCLTYTSAPLVDAVEVTGHPIVHLWVSSTADHGDLFFYLEDVDEQGQAVLITENPLRIGFAGLVDDDEQIHPNPGLEVRPDLPWHGYEEADYVDGILAGGAVVEVVNDLHPTSWVFREGHRVRVSIACSDWPTFRLNPHLYAGEGEPTNRPEDYVVPTITVYRDNYRPSRIELPVVP